CDGLFYEPVYRSALFAVDPVEFPALGGRIPWAAVRCPVAERAAYEESGWIPHPLLLGTDADGGPGVEALAKIAANPGQLRLAAHPLVAEKCRSRAVRDSHPRTR